MLDFGLSTQTSPEVCLSYLQPAAQTMCVIAREEGLLSVTKHTLVLTYPLAAC